MLRIVTDGAADMPQTWKEEYDIQVVPVNIHFGEQTFLSDVDLDREGFYRLVGESKKIPKTSQPSPHQFTEAYKKLAEIGDTILSIHVTSKLSDTYASAVAAGRELADKYRIIPFNSMTGSAGIGILCREARILERARKSVEEIIKHFETLRSRCGVILALDTLEYARMSGRVGTLQAALASILNVKPIAVLKDGVLNMAEKVRTRKASLDRLLEMVKEQVGEREVIMSMVHARNLFLTDLSISVAANLGPGTVGIVFFPME